MTPDIVSGAFGIWFERAPFSFRREDETIDIFKIFYDYKT
jgi:hypothetical protein